MSKQHNGRLQFSRFATVLAALAVMSLASQSALADGVFRNGVGARSMALGGASVASPDQPLEAMYSNPAGLGFANSSMLQIGAVGAILDGDFTNSVNTDRHLHNSYGVLPEAAFVLPLKDTPFALGFSIIPEASAAPEWQFVDAPGGLGGTTSYGSQKNYAEFIAIRGAVGLSWKISDTLALGVDLGAEYNRNQLISPYVFQSNTQLKGFKTLLDLQTDGWGVNGTIGVVWHPVNTVSLGLSYRSMTSFDTHGDASGNAGVQLQNIGAGSFQPNFRYDAEVFTKLPQMVSGGASWQARDWVRVIGEVDWIDWSDAFDHLDIKLKNGSDADINNFLGTDHEEDVVPLNWKNSFVYRAGAEFTLSSEVMARVGYSYGASPVPASTLTPMSAAILENTLTCGLEWHHGRWSIAGAYQYDFPSTSNVGTSELQTGEFSNSRTTIDAHTVDITLGISF